MKMTHEVFAETVAKHGNLPALKVKKNGTWHTTTWAEYGEQVRRTARGFMKLGLEPATGVAIIGGNSPEWFVADMAAIAAGGFPAGIYATNPP